MDPLTHALSSYAWKRAAFPRAPRTVTLAMLIAGTAADVDSLSSSFGPSAYLSYYRTFCHSLLAAISIGLLCVVRFPFLKPKTGEKATFRLMLIATWTAALLHLLMDLCQSAGVQLLWPFSSRRFALDWVAHVDLWILAILLAGLLFPMLSGLVTEEIGARSKAPRGRLGATLALVALFLYMGLRFVFHGNAIAALESRTYRGEPSRRAAAFAESNTPFRWHGLVETERALHDVEVPVGPGAEFDPSSALTIYKPESSPALDAAHHSALAHRFLAVARFPKASVEQSLTGYHVMLRDFPYNRDDSSGLRVQVQIVTDTSGKLLSEELVWIPTSREFWWK